MLRSTIMLERSHQDEQSHANWVFLCVVCMHKEQRAVNKLLTQRLVMNSRSAIIGTKKTAHGCI